MVRGYTHTDDVVDTVPRVRVDVAAVRFTTQGLLPQ